MNPGLQVKFRLEDQRQRPNQSIRHDKNHDGVWEERFRAFPKPQRKGLILRCMPNITLEKYSNDESESLPDQAGNALVSQSWFRRFGQGNTLAVRLLNPSSTAARR